MSIATRDITVWIAALFAFPLAMNIPAALATDGLPDRGLPPVERGEGHPVHPARTTAHLPR